VLKSGVYSVQWMELMMICCAITVKRVGMLGMVDVVSVVMNVQFP
jgi:hypothetical protein